LVLDDSTLPPLILLLGHSPSHEQKCLTLAKRLMSGPNLGQQRHDHGDPKPVDLRQVDHPMTIDPRHETMLSAFDQHQRALHDFTSSLSEAAWNAQWMEGLEFGLWRAIIDGPFRYGRLALTAAHIASGSDCAGTCRVKSSHANSFRRSSLLGLNPSRHSRRQPSSRTPAVHAAGRLHAVSRISLHR
jgi:hypothetical protein